MGIPNSVRRGWECRFPDLSGEWTHWSIMGDSYSICLVSGDNLKDALDVVESNFGRFASIGACPARIGADGEVFQAINKSCEISRYSHDVVNTCDNSELTLTRSTAAEPSICSPILKKSDEKSGRSGAKVAFVVAGAVAMKILKPLLIGLKVFKGSVILKTALTMILSMWAYAISWGWAYGVAFVLLIFVHEMGHVYAIREFGIKSSVPIFIPFVGAFVTMKEMPKNVRVEAWIGIAGPLIGTSGAILCWLVSIYTGSAFWLAVAYSGFFINLFNLIPLSPLDGGRIVAAISPKLWIAGFILVLVMFFSSYNPLLFLILLPAGYNVYEYWKNRREVRSEYYEVDVKTKVQISLLYFGLLLFLVIAMSLTIVQH